MVTDSKVNGFLESLADALEISLDSLSKDAELNSLNWDSLAVISCIALADEHFGVMLSGEELAKVTIVQDIIDLISNKV